jgi:hypothetical protein
MTDYDQPLLGVRARTVYYNGAKWHSCVDKGWFWTDDELGHRSRRWTTVHTLNGVPRAYGIRLLENDEH